MTTRCARARERLAVTSLNQHATASRPRLRKRTTRSQKYWDELSGR